MTESKTEGAGFSEKKWEEIESLLWASHTIRVSESHPMFEVVHFENLEEEVVQFGMDMVFSEIRAAIENGELDPDEFLAEVEEFRSNN